MVTIALNYLQAFQILVIATTTILLLKFYEEYTEIQNSDCAVIQASSNLEPSVILAVISARRNFRQRASIRTSWGSAVKDLPHLKLKFFIGEECTVPLLDRKDEYSCQEANIKIKRPYSKHSMFWGKLNCKKGLRSVLNRPCYSGFGFRVSQPIKLDSIGVQYELLMNNENVQVVLKDPEEVLDSIEFRSNSCDIVFNSFCFIKLRNSFMLPKKFEGELSLSDTGNLKSTLENCVWETEDSVHFTFGRTEDGVETFDLRLCSYLIANFSLSDVEYLNKHIAEKPKRILEWAEERLRIEEDLQLELKKYQDIIMLTNVTDVYRNLSLKCLRVFQWSHKNYPSSSVLKLDDDVHVNINLLSELISSNWFHADTISIWSHFYYNRAVPLFGKWADFEFRSLSYPPFPSGSGYLVSRRLVKLLSSRAPFLRSFQGEDISVGIWTEVLEHEGETVKKNSVRCWLNSQSCDESFLIPELTLEQMVH